MTLKTGILILITSLVMIGCGNSETTSKNDIEDDNKDNVITKGFLVDPYIVGATVFWDKNRNGIKDEGEPESSETNSKGEFEFQLKIPEGERLVQLKKGFHEGLSYEGELSADVQKNYVISPLTTMKVKHPDLDIISKLAEEGIIIDEEDIYKDPVKNNESNLLIASLAMDSFLQISKNKDLTTNSNTITDIIKVIKESVDDNISASNLNTVVKLQKVLINNIKEDKSLAELIKYKEYVESNESELLKIKTAIKDLTAEEIEVFEDIQEDGSVILKNVTLNGKSIKFSKTPLINEEVTISINELDINDNQNITWEIINKPLTSTAVISINSDGAGIFQTDEKGQYSIKITLSTDMGEDNVIAETQEATFYVKDNLNINIENVNNLNSSSDPDKMIGTIENTYWVKSDSLTKDQLESLVSNYSFTIGDYSIDKGLLINIEGSLDSEKELEGLKLEIGVDRVYPQSYAGKDAYDSFKIPDDNGGFNDGGTNWHLESINMPAAWDITTGSKDLMLGVSDGGFDNVHEDLKGKFAAILTTEENDHGMAVTGSMSANSDNGIGISGINWNSEVIASYMGEDNIESIINTKKEGIEVTTVNNSWGYHIDYDFNPTSQTEAESRFSSQQSILGQMRELIKSYSDKVFVFAAGNGIKNGLGSSDGIYGVDAKYENGAIHYKNDQLNKLDNLFIVSTYGPTEKLRYYSAYGKSVDFAAPSNYTSLALDNGLTNYFSGTSSAAPIVSSVISLIQSVNPNITPTEIKTILTESATKYITQREINPSGELEYLDNPIPVINAGEALKLTKLLYDDQFTAQAKIIDVKENKAEVEITTLSDQLLLVLAEIEIYSSETEAEEDFNLIESYKSSDSIVEVDLDKTKRYHKIKIKSTIKHTATNTEQVTEKEIELSYSDVKINPIDNITLNDINHSASFILVKIGDSSLGQIEFTSDETLYLDPGEYRIQGDIENYKELTKDIKVEEDMSVTLDVPFTPIDIDKQGTISGYIYDQNGVGVENATISISGGALTNGYFSSTLSDETGYYKFTSVNLLAPVDFQNEDGDLEIKSFSLKVVKDNYENNYRDEVIVLDGKDREEIFYLMAEQEKEIVFSEDFENLSEWTKTGLWQEIDLDAENIQNKLFGEIVGVGMSLSVAPGDDSNGRLPSAGNVAWFGNKNIGAYMDEIYSMHGHASMNVVEGILESPYITLPSEGNISLNFDSWWEIESVNPNQNGVDLMEIYIVEEGIDYSNKCSQGIDEWLNNISLFNKTLEKYNVDNDNLSFTEKIKYIFNEWMFKCSSGYSIESGEVIKKLNPAIDPPVKKGESYKKASMNRVNKPFTSGGFNRAPIFTKEEINLNDYAGKRIKVKFKFNSVDMLFNGFRGWIVDNIEIKKQ